MDLYMKICPIKQLYTILKTQDPAACAAIICCEDADPGKLQGIRYVHAGFSDVGEGSSNAITRKEARKIAAFVDALPDQVERLYICCQAGQSRSPAVGASILLYFQQDDMELIWKKAKYQPNLYVFKTMCDEFGIPLTKRELHKREKINKQAFSAAIKASRKGKS